MARPRKARTYQQEIDELRARHVHCVSQQDINRDLMDGRLPAHLWRKRSDKYKPSCSFPEDEVCAAPGLATESLALLLEETRNAEEVTEDDK